jgi:hypothetical protein
MVHGWLTLGTTMPRSPPHAAQAFLVVNDGDATSKIGASEVGAPLRVNCWA